MKIDAKSLAGGLPTAGGLVEDPGAGPLRRSQAALRDLLG